MGNDSADVYMLKLNAAGDTSWNYLYGGYRLDEGYSISQDNDGGFLTAAYSQSFTADNNWEAYFIKTDSLGQSCTSIPVYPTVLHPQLLVDTISFVELNDIVVDNYNAHAISVVTSDSLFCFISTSVNKPEENFSASVFPNPFQNKITVELNTEIDFKNVTVKVFDIAGRDVSNNFYPVMNSSNKTNLTVDKNLTPGFYFLSIFTQKKLIKTFKLIHE